MRSAVRNVVSLFAAVLTGIAVLAPATPAPAAVPTAAQEFKADSGDRCGYGYTAGALAWRAPRPTIYAVVDIKGVVVDRPVPTDPGTACPDDRAYSTAAFVAYTGRTVVDSAVVRADNGSVDVALTLGEGGTATPVIDRVVVQICRYASAPIGISYCGSPQTYLPM